MGSLPVYQRVGIVILVGLTVAALSLTVYQSATGYVSFNPIRVQGASSPDAYPVVKAISTRIAASGTLLERGDVLLRADELDLRGAGPVEFSGILLEAAGRSDRVRVTFARNGQVDEADVPVAREQPRLITGPLIGATFSLVALVLMLRAPRDPRSWPTFTVLMVFSLNQVWFAGGSREITTALLALQTASDALFGPSLIMTAVAWYPKRPPRWWRIAPWLFLVQGPLNLARLTGWALPFETASRLHAMVNVSFMLTFLILLAVTFRASGALRRRQLRWLVFFIVVGVLPPLTANLLIVAVPEFSWAQGYTLFSVVLIPIGFLVATVRDNLFDVDRLISATVTYTVAIAALAIVALSAVEPVANALGALFGIPPSLSGNLVILAAIVVAVPIGRRLQPTGERLFFPGRRIRQREVQQLVEDLEFCDSQAAVAELVTERTRSVFQISAVTRFEPRDGKFVATEGPGTPQFDGRHGLAALLERTAAPARVSEGRRSIGAENVTENDRSALRETGAVLAVPIRDGRELATFLLLGPKRSGDIYTSTDLAQLSSIAGKASSELRRIAGEAALANERARSEELARLRAAADEANMAKSRFLAAASHDLRQPLHALGFLAEGLAARVPEGEARELVEKLQESTGDLSFMFDDLLDLSKLEAGTIEVRLSDLDLDRVLNRLVSDFEGQASQKGLVLRVLPTQAGVRSDSVLLMRILRNLVSNALRHTEHGEVLISGRRVGKEIEIEVSDTGPGIPEEKQREIFQEFVQLEGAQREGLGLGLAIVDRLTRLLGHTLHLESESGRGSAFRLRVPSVSLENTAHELRAAPARGTDLSGELVVVVDDDLAILEALRRTLEIWGCDVLVARQTEEAIEGLEARSTAPAAVLADYQLLGRETGVEAIRRIREHLGFDVAAVVVSGETSSEGLAAIADSGLAHLTKPVRPHRLRALLAELLRE